MLFRSFAFGIRAVLRFRAGERQFSLRGMLLWILVLSFPLAWYASILRECAHEQQAIAKLQKAGIDVRTDIFGRYLQGFFFGSWTQRRAFAVYGESTVFTARDMETLRDLHHLAILRINEGTFTDDDLVNLAAMPRLRELSLRKCPITGAGLRHLSAELPIRQIDLEFCPIDDAGLKLASRWKAIDRAELDGTLVTDDGLAHLATLPKLRHLSMNYSAVTDNGIRDHAEWLPRLDWLSLADTEITKAVIEPLLHRNSVAWNRAPSTAHRQAAAQLTAMGLRIHGVDVKGDPHNVAIGQQWNHASETTKLLGQLCNVTQVQIESSNVTDADIAILSELADLKTLVFLKTAITDNALRELSKQHHPVLKNIGLVETNITPQGTAHLENLPSLKELELPSMLVAAGDLRHFVSLQQLADLSFRGNPSVTDELAYQLQLLLPKATVKHDTSYLKHRGGKQVLSRYGAEPTTYEQRERNSALDEIYFDSPDRDGKCKHAWITGPNA